MHTVVYCDMVDGLDDLYTRRHIIFDSNASQTYYFSEGVSCVRKKKSLLALRVSKSVAGARVLAIGS